MTLVLFVFILTILVLVHEGGHFWMAKRFGIKVVEFGFGLPPKIKRLFVKGETEYTLNLLPLGGFVRLLGEDHQERVAKEERERAFFAKPAWQRGLVLVGGIMGNLLLAIFLFAVMYSYLGVPREGTKRVVIIEVVANSPADKGGLKQGEVVLSIDGQPVNQVNQFVERVRQKAGHKVVLEVARMTTRGTLAGQKREVMVVPRQHPPQGEGALGVMVGEVAEIQYDKKAWYVAPFYGAKVGLVQSYEWGKGIVVGLIKMGRDLIKGRNVGQEVAGPVGIYKMTGQVQQMGWLGILQFMAILSVNLAILNLLPLPALDGGRLLFVGLEKIIGKKRVGRIEGWVHQIGFVLLLIFLLWVSWYDLRR